MINLKNKKALSIVFIAIVIIVGFTAFNFYKNNSKDKSMDTTSLKFENENRSFKSIEPKTPAEEVVVEALKLEISDEYEKYITLFTESDKHNSYASLFANNKLNGCFTESISIDKLSTLEEEDYTNSENKETYYTKLNLLHEYGAYSTEVVKVTYTNKLSERAESLDQFGSGKWIRYYVLVKETKDSDFKIFDVYGF